MHLDKLYGRVTQEFFDKQSDSWRCDQNAIMRKIQKIQNAAPAPVEEAVDALRLTSEACRLFCQQTAAEQRRLFEVVIKQATWQNGELRAMLFEPFEIMRHSNHESNRKQREIAGSGQDLGIWLPTLDTFPTFVA